METPLLAAALIVKNEEENLPGCLDALRSLGSLLSQICVYDTGSTDQTVRIAREAGCVVEEGYWDQDFARARNAAADLADAKWVLSVDADERVVADVPGLRSFLRAALSRDLVGVDAVKVPWVDLRDGVESQVHLVYRLFRPGRARWHGRIHEQIVSTGKDFDPKAVEVPRATLQLRHIGYDDRELFADKLRRNLSVAEVQVHEAEAAGPDGREELIHALVDRARSRRDLGEVEEAVVDLQRVRGLPSGRTYRTFGMEILADTLVDLGRFDEALGVVSQLRTEAIANPMYVDWLQVRALMGQGETGPALALLRTIDILQNSLGIIARPRLLLETRMRAAMEEGELLEAAACLVNLMAAQGVIRRRYGDLLLKLSHQLPDEGLLELLVEHDRGYLTEIADELDQSSDPGPRLARELRKREQGRPANPHNARVAGAAFGAG